MRWLDGIPHTMDMTLSKFREIDSEGPGSLSCWAAAAHRAGRGSQRVRHDLVTEQ